MAQGGKFNWGDIFRLPQQRRRTYTYRPRMTIQRRVLGAIAVVILAALGWIYNKITGTGQTPPKETRTEVPRERESRTSTRREAEPAPRVERTGSKKERPARESDTPAEVDEGAARIAAAFKAQESDLWVQSEGRVKRLLPDDEEGSRHQNFIVELANGQTLKVSHNIDLADRVPVEVGDRVGFRGEYEWSEQGGVMHWTHHDPGSRVRGGWIEHRGKKYE